MFLFFTNLLTGIIVARAMGPMMLGVWIILQMIPSYAESFGRLKFDIAAVYFLGKKKYSLGDVVPTLNILALTVSAAIILVFLLWFDWFFHLLFANSPPTGSLKLFCCIMLLHIPLQFIYLNYSYLLIQREDVAGYNGMVVIKALLAAIGSIGLLLLSDWGLLAVVLPSFLSLLVSMLYGIRRLGPSRHTGRMFRPDLIKDLFAYGSRLYIGSLISALNTMVANFLVVFYLAPAQVAYFNMAQNKGVLLNKIPDAMNTILFPRVSGIADASESARLIAQAFRVALLILGLLGLLAFVFIRPLVHLLYGEDYLPMVIPFWILLPGLILSGAASVFNQYFIGLGRVDLSFKIPILPFLLQAGLAVLLIPLLGISGAAVSLLVGLLALSGIQIYCFLKMSPQAGFEDLLVCRPDVRTVISFTQTQLARIRIERIRSILTKKNEI